MDQQIGQSRSIRYSRPQDQDPLRWNWMSPVLLSPHNPEALYHRANVLLRSSNRGDTWTEISPRNPCGWRVLVRQRSEQASGFLVIIGFPVAGAPADRMSR